MMLLPPSLVYEEMKDFNSDLVINSFEDITKVYHQILTNVVINFNTFQVLNHDIE